MALLEVAKYQRRDFFCIHFDSELDPDKLYTNEFLKKNGYPLQEIIDMAEHFEGGGTDFETPLTRAKQEIENSDKFSTADIIFITDGECAVSNEWNDNFTEWKTNKNVKIKSILIDNNWNSDTSLELFSDEVHKLSSLNRDDTEEIEMNLLGGI